MVKGAGFGVHRKAWLLLLTLALPAAAQPLPDLDILLAQLAKYSAEYHKAFRQFVATEVRTQKHWSRSLREEQRTTVSDYYVVSLPSAPGRLVEFRETLSVDGRAVKDRRGKVLEMLNRPARDRAAEAERIARENRRYDLGMFQRFEEFTNMGLLYLDPRVQPFIRYELLPAEAGGVLSLKFREAGPRTVAQADDRPAPATGVITFAYPELRVLRVDFRLHEDTPDGVPYVHCIIDYEPGPEGLALPSRSRHFMPGVVEGPAPGAWESEARYTNYRRFSTDVKLTVGGEVPTESPAAPDSR